MARPGICVYLHLMDICFLACICLWQISQIQTSLFKVVVPRLVSTSPEFVSSSASHACPKNGKLGPHCWGRVRHNLHSSLSPQWQLHRLYAVSFGAGVTLWPMLSSACLLQMPLAFHCSMLNVLSNMVGSTTRVWLWRRPTVCTDQVIGSIPQHFEAQNILNVPNASILYTDVHTCWTWKNRCSTIMSAVDFERGLGGGVWKIWVMELWGVFHSSLLNPWCLIGPLYNR